MLHMNPFQLRKKGYRTTYEDSLAVKKITDNLLSFLPTTPRNYIVVCIGTDRSTGDSLGPLIGSLLADKRLRHLSLYGTLHNPVHALNLDEQITLIKKRFGNPFIIAIDACLGRKDSVGDITVGVGPLKPGAALRKKLPEVGDVHITGVVNVSGFMEFTVLQSTRLAIVMDLAEAISEVIVSLDDELMTNNLLPAVAKNTLGNVHDAKLL